jgi:hypothetical protein
MSGEYIQLCELAEVRGDDPTHPAQLVLEADTNRVMLRLINEGGFACADIDLLDLIEWLDRIAPGAINRDAIARDLSVFAAGESSGGH